MDQTRAELSSAHRLFALIGAGLHLAVGFLVFASPLVAPPWGVAVLWVAWLTGVVAGLRVWRRWIFGALLTGAATAVFWVLFILFGDVALGWSA